MAIHPESRIIRSKHCRLLAVVPALAVQAKILVFLPFLANSSEVHSKTNADLPFIRPSIYTRIVKEPSQSNSRSTQDEAGSISVPVYRAQNQGIKGFTVWHHY